MCSSPKDRGVRHTKYKHLHSINGDMMGDDHHYNEIAEAAIERRQAMKELEKRYKKRHPKQKKNTLWEKLMALFN